MKIPVNHDKFKFICDSSNECDEKTAFIKTFQNEKYEKNALENGAAKILTPKECHEILNISKNLKVVGITGTNGKTTTAAAIYSLFLDCGKKVALQGTRGCFVNDERIQDKSLTTPPILQTLANMAYASENGCEYFVMEVSSHAIVQKRIEGIDFALKTFTNISQDHLDFHKTMEEYIAVKSSFFSDESLKIINKDEKKLHFNPKNCLTYGIEHPATYKVNAYSLKDGITAVVQNIDKLLEIDSGLYGYFNLYNLLCAVAVVDTLEHPEPETLASAVTNFGGVSGRMQIVSEKPVVIVDFAHTPDGMLKVLEAMKSDNLVVLFGAGGDRDKTKRPLMAKIAKRFGKKVYITSDNPRTENPQEILKDICNGINLDDSVHVEVDREKAIKEAIENLKDNEILMILGKGDETYQEIHGVKHPFDDRELVKKYLN